MTDKEINKSYKEGEFLLAARNLAHKPYQNVQGNADKFFHKLVEEDSVAIWILFGEAGELDVHKKIYLEELASKWNLPISKVTALVRKMEDNGVVRWRHDGTGEDGTYIQITEKGIATAARLKKNTEQVYQEVMERFGKNRFIQLMGQMAELKEIVTDVINETGETLNVE
jgi:DNA-binding MarR family transcriptional regulator